MRVFANKLIENRTFRFVGSILLILILLYTVFQASMIIYNLSTSDNKDISDFIDILKNSFNILFFVIISLITILSYIRARKTLFTPIRTEVFKFQIKNFEEVLLYFQNKSEIDFTIMFDLHRILSYNAMNMAEEYIKHFFKDEVEINEDKKKDLSKDFVAAMLHQDYAKKYLVLTDLVEKKEKAKDSETEDTEITNPAIILDKWKKYEHGSIDYTRQYIEATERLRHFIASPLLPNELKSIIKKFQEKVDNYLPLVGKVITEVSLEMPEKFPTAKSISNFNSSGLWNDYNHKMEKLEDTAEEILVFISDYLRIEDLIK